MKKLNKKISQPFHLVDLSPWPLMMSLSLFFSMLGIIVMFKFKNNNLFLLGLMFMIIIMFMWFKDILSESCKGFHTVKVQSGFKLGMMLFIASEALFFISIFWAYFHAYLCPDIELGCLFFNMKGIEPMSKLPLASFNTLLLLVSGILGTWSHYSLILKKYFESKFTLLLSCLLGLLFSLIQLYEYYMCSFTIVDNIYGSLFFMATGFHGLHVLIGGIYLFINWLTFDWCKINYKGEIGLHLALWYWHFVDLIWLFLYFWVYY